MLPKRIDSWELHISFPYASERPFREDIEEFFENLKKFDYSPQQLEWKSEAFEGIVFRQLVQKASEITVDDVPSLRRLHHFFEPIFLNPENHSNYSKDLENVINRGIEGNRVKLFETIFLADHIAIRCLFLNKKHPPPPTDFVNALIEVMKKDPDRGVTIINRTFPHDAEEIDFQLFKKIFYQIPIDKFTYDIIELLHLRIPENSWKEFFHEFPKKDLGYFIFFCSNAVKYRVRRLDTGIDFYESIIDELTQLYQKKPTAFRLAAKNANDYLIHLLLKTDPTSALRVSREIFFRDVFLYEADVGDKGPEIVRLMTEQELTKHFHSFNRLIGSSKVETLYTEIAKKSPEMVSREFSEILSNEISECERFKLFYHTLMNDSTKKRPPLAYNYLAHVIENISEPDDEVIALVTKIASESRICASKWFKTMRGMKWKLDRRKKFVLDLLKTGTLESAVAALDSHLLPEQEVMQSREFTPVELSKLIKMKDRGGAPLLKEPLTKKHQEQLSTLQGSKPVQVIECVKATETYAPPPVKNPELVAWNQALKKCNSTEEIFTFLVKAKVTITPALSRKILDWIEENCDSFTEDEDQRIALIQQLFSLDHLTAIQSFPFWGIHDPSKRFNLAKLFLQGHRAEVISRVKKFLPLFKFDEETRVRFLVTYFFAEKELCVKFIRLALCGEPPFKLSDKFLTDFLKKCVKWAPKRLIEAARPLLPLPTTIWKEVLPDLLREDFSFCMDLLGVEIFQYCRTEEHFVILFEKFERTVLLDYIEKKELPPKKAIEVFVKRFPEDAVRLYPLLSQQIGLSELIEHLPNSYALYVKLFQYISEEDLSIAENLLLRMANSPKHARVWFKTPLYFSWEPSKREAFIQHLLKRAPYQGVQACRSCPFIDWQMLFRKTKDHFLTAPDELYQIVCQPQLMGIPPIDRMEFAKHFPELNEKLRVYERLKQMKTLFGQNEKNLCQEILKSPDQALLMIMVIQYEPQLLEVLCRLDPRSVESAIHLSQPFLTATKFPNGVELVFALRNDPVVTLKRIANSLKNVDEYPKELAVLMSLISLKDQEALIQKLESDLNALFFWAHLFRVELATPAWKAMSDFVSFQHSRDVNKMQMLTTMEPGTSQTLFFLKILLTVEPYQINALGFDGLLAMRALMPPIDQVPIRDYNLMLPLFSPETIRKLKLPVRSKDDLLIEKATWVPTLKQSDFNRLQNPIRLFPLATKKQKLAFLVTPNFHSYGCERLSSQDIEYLIKYELEMVREYLVNEKLLNSPHFAPFLTDDELEVFVQSSQKQKEYAKVKKFNQLNYHSLASYAFKREDLRHLIKLPPAKLRIVIQNLVLKKSSLLVCFYPLMNPKQKNFLKQSCFKQSVLASYIAEAYDVQEPAWKSWEELEVILSHYYQIYQLEYLLKSKEYDAVDNGFKQLLSDRSWFAETMLLMIRKMPMLTSYFIKDHQQVLEDLPIDLAKLEVGSQVGLLPLLNPGEIHDIVSKVPEEDRKKALHEQFQFTPHRGTVEGVMDKVLAYDLQKTTCDSHIWRLCQNLLNAVSFYTLSYYFTDLKQKIRMAWIPVMNDTQHTVVIPMIEAKEFANFVKKQKEHPEEYYMHFATEEQKLAFIEIYECDFPSVKSSNINSYFIKIQQLKRLRSVLYKKLMNDSPPPPVRQMVQEKIEPLLKKCELLLNECRKTQLVLEEEGEEIPEEFYCSQGGVVMNIPLADGVSTARFEMDPLMKYIKKRKVHPLRIPLNKVKWTVDYELKKRIEVWRQEKINLYLSQFEDLSQKNEWDRILFLGSRALNHAKLLKNTKDEARITVQLSTAAFFKGDFDQALVYVESCQALPKDFNDPSSYIEFLCMESTIYRNKNAYKKSAETGKKALSFYKESKLHQQILLGKIYCCLGEAYSENPQSDRKKALESYRLAKKCFLNGKDTNKAKECFNRISHLQKGQEQAILY